MSMVPKATVIIANPTHYAVALKYDRNMQAPLCVAKGVDDLALLVDLLTEGWRGLNTRLDRIEAALEPSATNVVNAL